MAGDQIEEVKHKVDIVELIQEYLPLKRAGRNYKGLCPFHGEKSPSFMVNPELQIFKCFGCSEGGDAFAFLQKIEGLEFGEALKSLAKRVGVTLTSYKPTQAEELKDRLVAINSMAADYFHYLLTTHNLGKPALEYLKQRQITTDSITKFKLGFAPDGWDFLLKFLVSKKKFDLNLVRQTGLVIEGKNYDRFRNRIMFPLNNHRGQVVGFAGRVMPGADEKAGGKYVNTPETALYHKSDLLYALDITRSEIKSAGFAVVVEGEIDAIASYQAGIKNVVAIKGSALTERQIEILQRICDTVVLSLDTDIAGDAASRRGITLAEKRGLIVKIATIHGAKDPGDLATQDPALWRTTVAEAIPIYDFYIKSAIKRFGLDVVGKKKISQELLPIWQEIDDQIIKAHYIKKLAEVLDVGEQDVRGQLGKTQVKTPKASSDAQDVLAPKTRRDIMEAHVVGLAIQEKRWSELPHVLELVETNFWRKVVEHLIQKPDLESLPKEYQDQVQDLFLTEAEFDEKEWHKSLHRLEELAVHEQIRQLGQDADPKRILELTRRLGELTRQA